MKDIYSKKHFYCKHLFNKPTSMSDYINKQAILFTNLEKNGLTAFNLN